MPHVATVRGHKGIIMIKRVLLPLVAVFGCVLFGMAPQRQQPDSAAGASDLTRNPLSAEQLRRTARLASAYEISRTHWEKLENDEETRPLSKFMSKETLLEAGLYASWTSTYLHLVWQNNAPKMTEFEKQGMKKIKGGADEVWEFPKPGVARYMRPIQARESCIICHPSAAGDYNPDGGVTLKPGKTFCVISMEFTFDNKKP
jgi:hypothetical protein